MTAAPPARPAGAPVPTLTPDDVARLREAFGQADFTPTGVLEVLGPTANDALARGEVVPGLRAARGDSPREVLVRLFLLDDTVPANAADNALRPLGADRAAALGLLAASPGGVRAEVDLRPHADDRGPFWLACDRLPPADETAASDHVPGISSTSRTLAKWTVRDPAASALDVGVGSGLQSLYLSRHAGRVTATDRNPRALAYARLTAALSGIELELLEGDLLEPVAGRRFDLVVSNPPFVVSPAGEWAYRDSGLPGDLVGRRLVEQVPAHLTEGGVCQLLTNWLHVRGQDWQDRLASWVAGRGCDLLVVERDLIDPATYVTTWMRDARQDRGPGASALYDAWLGDLERQQVEGLGIGVITLRRTDAEPVVRCEHLEGPVEVPCGWTLRHTLDVVDLLRSSEDDAGLLRQPFTVRPDVRLEQRAESRPDGPGWSVVAQRLTQERGLARDDDADPMVAALVGSMDGRPLGEVLDGLASRSGAEPAQLRERALPVVRELLLDGYLRPAG